MRLSRIAVKDVAEQRRYGNGRAPPGARCPRRLWHPRAKAPHPAGAKCPPPRPKRLFRTIHCARSGRLAGGGQPQPAAGQTRPASATLTPRRSDQGPSQEKYLVLGKSTLEAGRHTHYTRFPMAIALHTPGRASQSHQGIGARLVRRLGGAVRSAITLAGALRRPAAAQTSRDHAAAQHPEAPAPSRVPVPQWSHAALPAPLPLPPWLAPLLARRHRRSASVSRPAFLKQGDVHFTPETFPQLTPKACAVLNTPLKDCDPKTLELVVSTFTQYITQVMAPEAGISDRAAMLPNLWHRLSTALDDAKADTSLPATPGAVPAAAGGAAPDAPVVSPHAPVQAPPTEPRPSAKDALLLSPLPLSDSPDNAVITSAAPQTTPDPAAPSAPVGHASRPHPGRSFRYPIQSVARWRAFHCFRALFPSRGVCDALPCLPPPWRLYYAACTGPP